MDTTIADKVKAFVLEEFLPGEDPDELTDSTELVSSNILDSLAILKLFSFLEEECSIVIAAHEADEEHMNTLADIAVLVNSKLG